MNGVVRRGLAGVDYTTRAYPRGELRSATVGNKYIAGSLSLPWSNLKERVLKSSIGLTIFETTSMSIYPEPESITEATLYSTLHGTLHSTLHYCRKSRG